MSPGKQVFFMRKKRINFQSKVVACDMFISFYHQLCNKMQYGKSEAHFLLSRFPWYNFLYFYKNLSHRLVSLFLLLLKCLTAKCINPVLQLLLYIRIIVVYFFLRIIKFFRGCNFQKKSQNLVLNP